MTRALHADTRVQRGPARSRKRGTEPRDASPRAILLAMATFIGVLLAGSLFAALLYVRLGGAPTGRPVRTQEPPPPRLVADPVAARQRIEAMARRHVDEARLAQAIDTVVANGWDAGAPPRTHKAP